MTDEKKLSFSEQRSLIGDYLKGDLTNDQLAEKYKVSTLSVSKYIASPIVPRTDLEKGIMAIAIGRETQKIIEIKDNMLNFFSKVLNEANSDDSLQKWIPDIRGILLDLDKIQRLNTAQPTDIIENRSISLLLERIENNQGDLVNQTNNHGTIPTEGN